MACNPCCCWSIRDGAVTIGIWSAVYALASLVLFGWQFAVLNNCRSVTMAQANLQCEYYCPCVGASTERTSSLIEALFVIQILCLIVAFFLIFASIALIYGAHTFSKYLVYPWFPCMIGSILCSLAYCIIWWTGDVRDYWLVLTILEMIAVFINLYCLVVVIMFSRQMNETRDYYAEKQRSERFDSLPERYDEYKKDNYNQFSRLSELDYPMKPGKGYGAPPMRDEYNRLPDRAPEYYEPPMQTVPYQRFDEPPRPAHFEGPGRPASPYRNRFDFGREDDMVSNWVREQQLIGLEEHANSEPASPTKEPFPILQHSLSVPSMYAETSGATTCRHHCHKFHHHHHRSSSRHRTRDRDKRGSSHRHGSKHRHRSASDGSKSRRSYSSSSSSSVFTEEPRHRRHRSRSRHRYSDDGTDVTEESREGHRKHHRRSDRDRDHDKERRGPRRVKRNDKDRESKSSLNTALTQDIVTPAVGVPAEQTGEWQMGCPQGSITIPQHIIIPPSSGTLGPDKRPQPQTYQINSEIRISYDQQGRPVGPETAILSQGPTPQPHPHSSPANSSSPTAKQRTQPISITSIV